MPRTTTFELPSVDYLQILDEEGAFDEDLGADVDEDLLVDAYRAMLLARRFDERLLQLQRQGNIGTFAPVKGQEAAQVGAVSTIAPDDWMVPAFRETAAALWRGLPLTGLLLYNAGYNEGGAIPEEQKDLPIAIPVASQLPHAVGIAYAARLQQTGEVVLTFFGDGATSEGDFHEALNFAGVFQLPVVFLCQNNGWAISVPRDRQTASETLAQKALAYGFPGIQVDGNDFFAVRLAVSEAVERARSGEGPTMVEAVTYRLSVHTTADDPSRYRNEDEVAEWERRDPLPRLQCHLLERELLTSDRVEQLEEEIQAKIDDAWQQAQSRMSELDDPVAMFDHLYAEVPAYLRAQRTAFAERRGEVEHG